MKRSKSAKIKDTIESAYAMAANIDKDNKNKCPLSFTEKIERELALSALDNGEINDLNPHSLAASANPNILSHSQAKKADDFAQFQAAMKDKVQRMLKNEIFEEVFRDTVPPQQRVLRSVWSHRCKTTLSGEVYRYHSCLCVDGSQQQFGIDFTDTYSPVVSWTTVRILMILSKILGLKARQVDYVQAFPQVYLPGGEDVYMEIPDSYTCEGDIWQKCLK